MTDRPRVDQTVPTTAVVVLARNEADRIERCLDALLAQSVPPGAVIVVDHASQDGTAALVAARRDPRLHLVEAGAGIGMAAARNLGVAASHAGVIFFTDADCKPHRHWLAEGLAALQADDTLAGVEGTTYYEAGSATSIADIVTHQFTAGEFMTCNVAYRREALEKAGGFDPRFAHGHEDRDLAWRIRKLGPVAFVPAMVVAHQRKRHTARSLWRLARRASDLVLFFKLHGRQAPCIGRILYPGRLVMLFFPPLLLVRESVRSPRDLWIAAVFYVYIVRERLLIWRAALRQRLFII